MATINLSELDPKLIAAVKRDVQKIFEEEAHTWSTFKRGNPDIVWLHSRLKVLQLQLAGQKAEEALTRIYWSCVNLTGRVNWEIADKMFDDWVKEQDGRQTTGTIRDTD
jgi:hypothetical protein